MTSGQGPLGDAFNDLRARLPHADVGVVGLGVGSAAAYAHTGDTFSFFEIDRTVADIAGDPAYFTYLSDAPVRPRIVLGDARLSLTDEPAGSLDLLVLDAFSSDAVPAHLLTQQAMEVYRRLMRPRGLIVFHVELLLRPGLAGRGDSRVAGAPCGSPGLLPTRRRDRTDRGPGLDLGGRRRGG